MHMGYSTIELSNHPFHFSSFSVGDPVQMPATVISKVASNHGYDNELI
ncbi:hypothetical protein OROGR_030750 [Orobanche gracilis]